MKIYWKYGPCPSCLKVPAESRIHFIRNIAHILEPDGTIIEIPIDYITTIS